MLHIAAFTVVVLTIIRASYSPRKFFYRKDRSQETYPDPLPNLEHEFAEINGVS